MKMMETVAALFIFFVLLAMSLVFFFIFNQKSAENAAQEYLQNDQYNLLLEIPNHPLLKCSFLSSEEECLDTIKLLTPLEGYGNRRIQIERINANPLLKCTPQNYPNCNTFIIYDNNPSTNIALTTPITIYYPLEKIINQLFWK